MHSTPSLWRMCRVLAATALAAVFSAAMAPRVSTAAEPPPRVEDGGPSLPPAPANLESLKFQRIFAPADRIRESTRAGERFLPVPREEFSRLVGERQTDSGPAARIERAFFRAELDDTHLVKGTAELEIVLTGSEPSWLELATRGLAPAGLRWDDDRPAHAGAYRAEHGNASKRGVTVEKSGTAAFSWSAQGQEAGDGAAFALTFPKAITTSFVLLTPATTQLAAEGATIQSVVKNEAGAVEYRIAVRGGQPFVLHATSLAAESDAQAFAASDTTSYDVKPSATEVDVVFRVVPLEASAREIVLRCSPALQVIDVTLSGQPLAFTEASSPAGTHERVVTLALTEPLPPDEAEIRVRGLASTTLGEPMILPAIMLQRSIWLGGTLHLVLDDDLELHDLVEEGCEATELRQSPADADPQWTFQKSTPDASLRVHVNPAPKRLRGRMLTSAQVGSDEIVATTTLDLTSEYGIESLLRVRLVPGWQIESVESQPAGIVRSWFLEHDEADRALIVLDQPVGPQNPVRLRLKARLQRSANGSQLRLMQLDWLRPLRLHDHQHWIEVVPGPSVSVSPEEPHAMATLQREDVPPGLGSLVSDRRETYLFSADARAEQNTFRTGTRAADLVANIGVAAHVTDSLVRHAYRVSVEPRSGEVGRLGLVFSQPLSRGVQWRFLDAFGSDIPAERLASPAAEEAAQPPLGSIRWQLGQPQSEPFDLLVSFEEPRAAATPVILAAVEATNAQTATVQVTGERALRLSVENRGLEPIPVIDAAQAADPSVRTYGYRYQPERVLAHSAEPSPLVVRRVDPGHLPPGCWVRLAELDSTYLASGRAVHHLSLSLESHAAEDLQVSIPRARHVLYRVAGGGWLEASTATPGGAITIPLPADEGQATLEVRFEEVGERLGAAAVIRPPAITFSAPAGRMTFRAWVPREYQAAEIPQPRERLLAGVLFAFRAWLPSAAADARGRDSGTTADVINPPAALTGRLDGELHELPVTPQQGGTQILHATTVGLWCVALLILGGMLGAKLSRLGWHYVLLAAAAGFAVTLLMPAAYAPHVSALSWGCLAAAVVQLVRAPLSRVVSRLLQWVSGYRQEALATSTAAILCCGLWATSCGAEQAPGADRPDGLLRVIDPIDESREPAGPYVYVPESLYSTLLRREREDRAPLGEWLITRCHVRGALVETGGQYDAEGHGWTMLLEVETFHRDAVVRLPLDRQHALWPDDAVRVDGARTAAWWFSPDGATLSVRVAEPGHHHLELALTPHIRRQADVSELSLPLVGALECHLELSVPEQMPPLAFPGVLGEVRYLSAFSAYRGFVGPLEQLVVLWPVSPPPVQNRAFVDMLSWMHLQRTATLIEQRLVVRAEGQPVSFDVVPPPGVRFLPSGGDVPHVRITPPGRMSQRISVLVDSPHRGELVIPLKFVVEHAPAASSIAVPRFAIEGGAQVADRWLAVDAPADLRATVSPGSSAEPIDATAFVTRWGPIDTLPELAYREHPDAPAWRISIEPGSPRIEAAESTLAVAHPAGIDVYYTAQCRVDRGALLLHRLKKPKAFSVSHIELTQGERSLPVRWTESHSGELRVFLPEPIRGAHTLSVRGEMPAGEDASVVIPLLSLHADERQSPRLTTARTAGSLLELDNSNGLLPAAGAPLPPVWQDEWHLHGQYSLPAAAGPALLRAKVARAEPPREVHTVAAVTPSLRGWDVALHCAIRGAAQPLDRLVFFVPKSWEGGEQVEPAGRFRLSVHPTPTHNRLVLRPLAPIENDVQVTVRGQLLRERSDLVTIPTFRVVEPALQDALLALPRRTSGQATAWRTQNLQQVESTHAVEQLIGDESRWSVFRKSGETATARLSIVEQEASAPHISFMEAQTWVTVHEPPYVETTFTLDPRGRRSCQASLPQGYRLLDVSVNGRSAAAWQDAAGRWQVQLDSSQLPQLITVACQAEADAAHDARHVHSPILLADGARIPVAQTVWHILSDASWRRADERPGRLHEVSGPMLAAVRLANLTESLDEILPALTGGSETSWSGWLAHWRGRIAAADERYLRRAAVSPPDPDAAQEAAAARQRVAKIDEALQPLAHATAATTGDDAWDAAQASPGTQPDFVLRLLGDGRVDSIRLLAVAEPRDYALDRLLGALLLAIVVGGAFAFQRRGAAADRGPSRWQIGALCALALAALLASFLWAIAAALAVAALAVGHRAFQAPK